MSKFCMVAFLDKVSNFDTLLIFDILSMFDTLQLFDTLSKFGTLLIIDTMQTFDTMQAGRAYPLGGFEDRSGIGNPLKLCTKFFRFPYLYSMRGFNERLQLSTRMTIVLIWGGRAASLREEEIPVIEVISLISLRTPGPRGDEILPGNVQLLNILRDNFGVFAGVVQLLNGGRLEEKNLRDVIFTHVGKGTMLTLR